MAAVRVSSSSILSPTSSAPTSYAGVAKRKGLRSSLFWFLFLFFFCHSFAIVTSGTPGGFFKAELCLHVLQDGQEPCTKVPKGAVVGIKNIACTPKQSTSELEKVELAKAAMKPTMEKYGILPEDTHASLNADASVHLEADVIGVLDTIMHELLDIRRERSLSVVSSSINSFTDRFLLWPLGIDEPKKRDYFVSLRSDENTRAKATELLSQSGVNITVDQLLQFRRAICLPRNGVQHGIAEPQDFETALGDMKNLDVGDQVLLKQLHLLEFNYAFQ